MSKAFDIPLHWLRIPEPIAAGMNILVICSIALQMRNSHEPVDPPILVTKLGPEAYQIVEGRHRWVGSLVAGRTHIAVTLASP